MQATSGEYVRKQTEREREEKSKGSKKNLALYGFALLTNFRALPSFPEI